MFVFSSQNLAQAKTPYGTLLGIEPYVDGAYYVDFRVGDQQIGLDPTLLVEDLGIDPALVTHGRGAWAAHRLRELLGALNGRPGWTA